MSVLVQEQSTPRVVPGTADRLLLDDSSLINRPDLAALSALLGAAGLTGRGGAGFPTGVKLATVASQQRRPALVINAMEGEPLAHKDETLLALAPGLVLDGADILAHALRAKRVVIGVGSQIPTAALRAAVETRRSRVEIQALPDSFVRGQESALVSGLNGRSGLPTDPATPMWQRGLGGRPTMVVNAETAAQVALVVRHGVDWFRAAGTSEDPGTFLLSVSGTTNQVITAGVTEAERGTLLADVLARFGVRTDLVGGVLVGGYHGAWLPASALDTPLDRSSLASWGASPGAGVIQVLDRRHCPLEVTAGIVTYLAGQSARQCGPCINGLPMLAETLTALASNVAHKGRRSAERRRDLTAEVVRLSNLVEGRGACAHPDGTVRLVRSTLRTFAGHVEAHVKGGCPR